MLRNICEAANAGVSVWECPLAFPATALCNNPSVGGCLLMACFDLKFNKNLLMPGQDFAPGYGLRKIFCYTKYAKGGQGRCRHEASVRNPALYKQKSHPKVALAPPLGLEPRTP